MEARVSKVTEGSFSNPATNDHVILMYSPIRLKSCHSSDEVYSVSSIFGMLHYYVNQQPAV